MPVKGGKLDKTRQITVPESLDTVRRHLSPAGGRSHPAPASDRRRELLALKGGTAINSSGPRHAAALGRHRPDVGAGPTTRLSPPSTRSRISLGSIWLSAQKSALSACGTPISLSLWNPNVFSAQEISGHSRRSRR